MQTAFQWTIPIQSRSENDVEILGWDLSCSACTKIEPATLVVPAHATRNVKVIMDLAKRRPVGASSESYPFEVALRPVLKHPHLSEEQPEWLLRGSANTYVTASPTAILLGERSILAGPFPQESVTLTFLQPVAGVGVKSAPEVAATVTRDESDAPAYLLTVKASAIGVGAVERELIISATDPKGAPLPSLSLKVTGRVVPDIETVPGALTLGVRELGEPPTESIALRSRTGRPFRIDCETSDSPALVPSVLDGGASRYSLTQRVEKQGFHKHALCFHV